ncbi:hypothetical protein MNBD_GAMMA13-2079 [hydrothermal vent metagenome]|uniref:Uncharacterized protein n=1 Tax=hydrothermal vent metagenome TaxID=652676 RepID=A0A3B0YL44_9ZZZZ
MRTDVNVMSVDDDESKLRRANIRMALLLAVVAVGILAMFFWSVTSLSTGIS